MTKSERKLKRRRVTAWDVAKSAGVNQSVVSRAFDPNSNVAPQTRKRLLALAREMGYAPNALARGLLTGKTQLVGITIVQINLEISGQLLQNLGLRLLEANLQPMLLPVREGQDLSAELKRLFTYEIDALILISAAVTAELLETVNNWERPVILVNRHAPGEKLHSIRTDDVAAGATAADHLFASGARRFAFLSGPSDATSSDDRFRGFADRLARIGAAPAIRLHGDFTYQTGLKAGDRLFRSDPGIDGIFAANDMMAIGLLDAARRLGVKVPEQAQIIGFDDISTASMDQYRLTTFRHNLEDIVQHVLKTLNRVGSDEDTCIVDISCPAAFLKRSTTL